MRFGTQLVAPIAFDSFVPNRRYYFAGLGVNGQAILVFFSNAKHGRRVWLFNLAPKKLKELLSGDKPKLIPLKPQSSSPEWLAEQEGIDWEHVEERRYAEKKATYREQVDRVLLQIGEALSHETEILLSGNPLRELNQYARKCPERVHPHRFQVNFFAYVLHDRDLWALKQAIGKKGKWDRTGDTHGTTKFGRPSTDPENCFNSPSWPAKLDMVKSYLERCGLGISMASIHTDYLVEDLKCKVTKTDSGSLTFINPTGGPIYSYGTFRSVVVAELGLAAVQESLYGEAKVHASKVADEGNFTAQYSTLMGGFETDVYYCAERPRSMFSDEPAEPLAVAIGLDGKTSGIAGVGFALGGENQEAYRSMLFFAVAPNWYLAKIYGIPQEHLDDWIVKGLPPGLKSDRGPAGHQSLVSDLIYKFKLKSITPSWRGQAKAQVETTHPKSPKLEGEPTFVQSNLSAPQMMKQAIYRARAHNRGRDISERMSDQEVIDFREARMAAVPDNYWTYCDDRLMNSSRHMSLKSAVRAWWTPIKFRVDSEGVRHRHRHFNSAEFKEEGLHERLARIPSIELNGYCLSTVFRSVWVEIDGRLIEVEATTRAQVDGEDQMVPMSEVEQVAAALGEVRAITRRNAQAAAAQARADFHEATGKHWADGRRERGTPKRGKGLAAQEAAAAKGKRKRRDAA